MSGATPGQAREFGDRFTVKPDTGIVRLNCFRCDGFPLGADDWDVGYHPSLDVLIEQARAHDAAKHAAQEPYAAPPVYVCPDCGAEDDDEAVIARHMASKHAAPEPDLATVMARVRRALEDSPTASIARREALEIINASGVKQ